MSALSYLRGSFIFSAICLLLGAGLGWYYGGTVGAIVHTMFIVLVLGILETSLSFDNAVVNATVLKHMDAVWRRRFLTWGIAIAVFGMRIVFPLIIVCIAASVGPWDAIVLAASHPEQYSKIMMDAHMSIAAFGGAFLMLVGLKFFFNVEKETHWLGPIERKLSSIGKLDMIEVGLTITAFLVMSQFLPDSDAATFLICGLWGILTFIGVEALAGVLEASDEAVNAAHKTGVGGFLYLEVLDASFSFDGVIGAFALTNNLFIIAIGLAIGAMFVRSMTIMLVEKGTLAEYRYLENGAFWAIIALASCMLAGAFFHVPEVITGLIGATFIGLSLWSSIRANRKETMAVAAAE